MADEIVGTGAVVITLDDSSANRTVVRLADQLERTLDRASAQAGAKMRRNIDRALAGLGDVTVSVNVLPDTTGFDAQVQALSPTVDVGLRLDTAPVNAVIDRVKNKLSTGLDRASRQAAAAITRNLTAALRAFSPATVKVEADTSAFDRAFSLARSATGSAVIDITPNADAGHFRRAAQAAAPPDGVKVRIVPDIREFVQAARTLRLRDIPATIKLDVDRAMAGVDRLAAKIENEIARSSARAARTFTREIDTAIREIGSASVRVDADLSEFEAGVQRVRDIGETTIKVMPDVNRTEFRLAVQAELDGIEVKVKVVPDVSGFDRAVREITTPTIHAQVETDVDHDRITRSFAAIGAAATRGLGAVASFAGTALKIGAIGIAAAGAAQGVGALVGALAPAAGLLIALPAVVIGVKVAMGALKIALLGVKDSFSAALGDDAEKFEKSLENLSPAAQSAAREVRAMKPAVDALKTSVQDAFFKPLEGQITATAKALQGPLTQGLSGITMKFGQAAASVLDYIRTSEGVSNVEKILAGTSGAFEGLGTAAAQVTQGILAVGGAIADRFGGELASGISGLAQKFGTFLTESAKGGNAVSWVDNALNTLAQLGNVLGHLGGIFGAVFSAANAGGGSLLQNLGQITGSFETFVKSAEGTKSIQGIFQAIGSVAAQLGPILSAVVSQVGAIAPSLAPLFTTIGPAIVNVINAIGPAVQGVLPGIQALVTGLAEGIKSIGDSGALAGIGQAIGGIATAIAPVLPVVGQLVGILGNLVAQGLTQLTNALSPVLSALGTVLPPVLNALGDVFGALMSAIAPVANLIGQTLAQILVALGPVIVTVANAFTQIVTALAPLIVQLVSGLSPILSAIGPLITTVVTALTPLITALVAALLPVLPPLVDAFLAVVNAMLPLLPVIGQLVVALAPLLTTIVTAIAPIIQFAAEIIKWEAINIVVPIIQSVVSVVLTIIDAVVNVVNAVTNFVQQVVGFFGSLAGQVKGLVGGLVSAVANFFASMLQGALNAVTSLVNGVVSFFGQLPGRVLGVISSLLGSIGSFFSGVMDAAKNAVSTGIDTVVNFFKNLPSQILTGLGNLTGLLVSAGGDLIRGMINGIKNLAGSLVSAAKDVVGSAIDGAKSLLGIHSPSKVFFEIGQQTGQGLVNGLESMAVQVGAASKDMAAAAVKPFDNLSLAAPSVAAPGSSLTPITQPFGNQSGSQLDTVRSTRQTAVQGPSGGRAGATITNTFNITEVGDADTTAERVVNRMVTGAGVFL